ncbi:unknown [Anaerotruncus sp. CAG:390]|nr:unknown [Anaerotruncus sp. CAG:390]
MLFEEILTNDYAALDQRCRGLLFPFFGEVESHAKGRLFRGYGCDLGLGEHAERRFAACKSCCKLVGGGIRVVKGNVGNAGTLYKRAEDKFGVRSLTGEVNRLARKVAEALHCFAVLYEIEHAESVDGKHADVALGLIVEHCGKVGGHCGNVRIAVDDKGAYKIGCRIGVDLGVEVGFTRFYAGNEGSGAPTRSAVENGDAKLCVVLFCAGDKTYTGCKHDCGKQERCR